MKALPWWSLPLLACHVGFAGAERIQGELPRDSDFSAFVGKFCYDYSPDPEQLIGDIKVTVTREQALGDAPKQGKLYFMIFDDERGHWKRARRRWDVSSCEDKIADASLKTEINFQGTKEKMDYQIHIKERIRPRVWYFTFVACGIEPGQDFSYEVHATNSLWGWQEEFSLDHVNMYQTFFWFAVAYLVTTLGTFWATRWRYGTENLREHPYTQLLLLSYIASTASCTFFLAHYQLFMHDGFGSKRVRFLACLGSIVANCTIYLIAILSSIGWAISRGPLPHRRLFLGLITLLGAVHAICELRSELTIDQSTKLYAYQTQEGMINMILKIFMFCWFAYHCKMSFDGEKDERLKKFYKYLGLFISFWAVNVPVTVILASLLVPYYRYRVVTTVDIAVRLLGQVVLTQLFCGPLSPINDSNTFRSRLGDTYADPDGGFHEMVSHDNL